MAIVLVGTRDIVLQRRQEDLESISETHRSYSALQYTIIFSKGEDGYDLTLKQINVQTGALTNKKKKIQPWIIMHTA